MKRHLYVYGSVYGEVYHKNAVATYEEALAQSKADFESRVFDVSCLKVEWDSEIKTFRRTPIGVEYSFDNGDWLFFIDDGMSRSFWGTILSFDVDLTDDEQKHVVEKWLAENMGGTPSSDTTIDANDADRDTDDEENVDN